MLEIASALLLPCPAAIKKQISTNYVADLPPTWPKLTLKAIHELEESGEIAKVGVVCAFCGRHTLSPGLRDERKSSGVQLPHAAQAARGEVDVWRGCA